MRESRASSINPNPCGRQNTQEEPIKIDPEEREYYKHLFGFDPVIDAVPINSTDVLYRYEEKFSLQSDPLFSHAGVFIAARVNVGNNGVAHNRIVFSREGVESDFQCAHTVVYQNLSMEKLSSALEVPIEDAKLTNGAPVTLPSWGHFAALKSFVAGIAEVGIQTLIEGYFSAQKEKFSDSSFGVNHALITGTLHALNKVAPQATVALLRDYLMEILETVPLDWILPRREFLGWILSAGVMATIWKEAPEEWVIKYFGKMRVCLDKPFFWADQNLGQATLSA